MSGRTCARSGCSLWLAALFSCSFSTHCSLVYEPTSARQCSSDVDCQEQPQLSGLSCDTQHGLCVSKQAALAEGCESTAACVEQNGGRAALCRYPGSPCVRIETPDCSRVSGDWQRPDVLLLGSIGPHTVLNWDGSASPMDHAQRLLRAIDLGIEEWQREVPEGLLFSGRPIAMVHCNSQGDADVARRVMDHLVQDIQAPAVLALTDLETGAIVDQAVQSHVAVVHVESHGPLALPPRLEAGLVWRMLPPLEEQASLAAWRVSDLEQRIRVERSLPASVPLRVATLSDQGAAFDAFLAKFHELARFNGGLTLEENGASYVERRHSDRENERGLALALVGFAPDIIVVAMGDDFTSYYLRLLEAEWPPTLPRPQYVATLLSQELPLLLPVVAGDEDLRARLTGTGLFIDEGVARTLTGFQARYRERYGQEPGRTQSGYDAWYATALAIYSADAGGRFDGINIARHFERLQSGPATDVDPGALNVAKVYLGSQESIDLLGASSTLNWNPISQRVEADGGLWCLKRDSNGGLVLEENAGPHGTATGISGDFDCPSL